MTECLGGHGETAIKGSEDAHRVAWCSFDDLVLAFSFNVVRFVALGGQRFHIALTWL